MTQETPPSPQDPFDAIRYQIAPDMKSVTLTVPGPVTLDAAQLDRLVQSLAMMRAAMEPQHPFDPPAIDQWVYHQLDAWRMVPRRDATRTAAEEGFLMLVRSPGLGWSQSEIEPQHAAALLAFLQAKKPEQA